MLGALTPLNFDYDPSPLSVFLNRAYVGGLVTRSFCLHPPHPKGDGMAYLWAG